MVTELSKDILSHCGIELCENPEAFLADALSRCESDHVAVVPYGSHTLPDLGESG